MSIVTFWSDSRGQTGQTLAAIAVATRMSIERNSKILLISTSFGDSTMKNCFWGEEYSKNTNLFNGKVSNVAVENGIEGLFKLVTSNKLTPDIITDYTKVIFKGRLEIIDGYSGTKGAPIDENIENFRKMENCYIELIRMANQYYDVVIVDLDKQLSSKIKENILKISDANVFVLSQTMESINRYKELRKINGDLIGNRCVPVIGKYIREYKYNSKNIARYLQEKKELDLVPFNLLYMEAAEEVKVVDLFLKLKNVKDKTDESYIFMGCIQNLNNNIWKKLQDLQMRMR